MHTKKDALGDRMKTYEYVTRTHLMRRTPAIIRIDGKAFHTFTRGFQKPFDKVFMTAMQKTMKYLCENIQGCVLGYTQSDEITLVLTDYATPTTCAWFDYNIQKMTSIASSLATLAFNRFFNEEVFNLFDSRSTSTNDKLSKSYVGALNRGALFDARTFSLPKEEVVNCLIWRQQDATRNSIQSVAQANFSHKEIMNKNCSELQDMLMLQKGVNWNDFTVVEKRGTCCIKKPILVAGQNGEEVERNKWVIDTDIPIFTQDKSYVESRL